MVAFVHGESWKWLSQIAGAGDSELLHAIKAFLIKDFGQAFEIIRTQKLLSRSRCLETTTLLCAELGGWAKTAPLSKKERSKLIRHCKVTVGFQSMMSSMGARAESLEIWSLCFRDFAMILLSSLEAINIAFNQRLVEHIIASKGLGLLALNWTNNWMFRGTLDSAQLIFNGGRKRCSGSSDFKIGSPAAFVQSLDLAQETTEIMLAWDAYSFGGAQLTVTGNEIKVNRPDTIKNIRRQNYRQRMMELDIADRNSAHQRFVMLSDKLKENVATEEFSIPFDEFLTSPAGRRILEQTLPITKTIEKDIADALDNLIDLDAEVKLGRMRHVYRDLISIWCYIVRVAMAARIWGELVHSVTGQYPPTTVTIKRLKETFIGLREIPEPSVDKGIRHFSSFIDQKHHVDLFYQPLFRISEDQVLIPVSYILKNRFDRNLINVVAREKNDSLAVKGKKPLRKLRALFEKAGFRCSEDVTIRDSAKMLITDLDLLAYRDDDIFFFQSKVLSIPDSPYEYWKLEQTLLSAATQMDIVLNHKSQVEQVCQKENPVFNLEGKRISAYLVTDVMVYSGFSLGGYEVIDFDYLQHILRGGRYGMLDVLKQEVVGTFNVIEGSVPSAEEIRRLISALRVPRSSPLPATSQRRIELGGWALIIEVIGFA